jgi:hypothetical protein
VKRLDIFTSEESSQRQYNKVKILAALGLSGGKYSIFKVFTLYVVCTQLKISEEFFFFF